MQSATGRGHFPCQMAFGLCCALAGSTTAVVVNPAWRSVSCLPGRFAVLRTPFTSASDLVLHLRAFRKLAFQSVIHGSRAVGASPSSHGKLAHLEHQLRGRIRALLSETNLYSLPDISGRFSIAIQTRFKPSATTPVIVFGLAKGSRTAVQPVEDGTRSRLWAIE